MALSTALFSLICVVTFLFARMHGSTDYRNFFRNLVGPFWVLYEAAYMFSFVLILAVYGAAAGAIGVAMFGWPPLAGVLCLIASIAVFTMFWNPSVEWLFKYASFFLYGVYALFVYFRLSRFGTEAAQGLAVTTDDTGWATAGVTVNDCCTFWQAVCGSPMRPLAAIRRARALNRVSSGGVPGAGMPSAIQSSSSALSAVRCSSSSFMGIW